MNFYTRLVDEALRLAGAAATSMVVQSFLSGAPDIILVFARKIKYSKVSKSMRLFVVAADTMVCR